jgi:HEAT repeat protein
MLAKDADGAVRANALWALGNVGQASDVKLLESALSDRDVAAAGNAATALGRLAARVRVPAGRALCAALGDARSYVRANALTALRLAGERCDSGTERRLLGEDDGELVRLAAARLTGSVRPDASDRRALERCVRDDPNGLVAEACETPVLPASSGVEPVTVFVVPAGESQPVPRAPFALRLADGSIRLGISDRRGAVFEPAAPRGLVELSVPAPLSF